MKMFTSLALLMSSLSTFAQAIGEKEQKTYGQAWIESSRVECVTEAGMSACSPAYVLEYSSRYDSGCRLNQKVKLLVDYTPKTINGSEMKVRLAYINPALDESCPKALIRGKVVVKKEDLINALVQNQCGGVAANCKIENYWSQSLNPLDIVETVPFSISNPNTVFLNPGFFQ